MSIKQVSRVSRVSPWRRIWKLKVECLKFNVECFMLNSEYLKLKVESDEPGMEIAGQLK